MAATTTSLPVRVGERSCCASCRGWARNGEGMKATTRSARSLVMLSSLADAEQTVPRASAVSIGVMVKRCGCRDSYGYVVALEVDATQRVSDVWLAEGDSRSCGTGSYLTVEVWWSWR